MAKRKRKRRGADWAVVTIAALDLRKKPDHRAELGSQLLAGEVARVDGRSRDGSWWRIVGPDGYPGWARTWGLAPKSSSEAAAWSRRAIARVGVPYTMIRKRAGHGTALGPAYLHSRFVPLRRVGRWREVEMPVGRGWIESRHLAMGRRPARSIRRLVSRLLGVPYLWGGRTAMGLDCSGFVQMVMLSRGLALPRDAHDQFLAAKRLRKTVSPKAGDLVFFGPPRGRIGHVGILLDPARFAHARGTVRINSLEPGSVLYDRDLGETIRGFGRPANRG